MSNRIHFNTETRKSEVYQNFDSLIKPNNEFDILEPRYDFDYIVCFYFGKRRGEITNQLLNIDRYIFVKRHLEFLLNNKTVIDDVVNIIFVISNCNDIDYNNVSDIVNSTILKDKIIVINKNNDNYSYGAWNTGLITRINENIKYAFLCEDDYVPINPDFHKIFINYFKKDVVYVCQLYREDHASISNGFICYDKCKESYKLHGNPLKLVKTLNGDTTYNEAIKDQINFLGYYKQYRKLDICDKYYSDFYNVNSIVRYGNTNGSQIIKPIME
jgi:hypothetical protein